MIGIINNTLHILATVTNSKSALLVKLNNSGHAIISVYGGSPEDYSDFAGALFKLRSKSNFEVSEVETLPDFKTILRNLNVESCFIENVYLSDDRNDSVYLFLFLNDVENNIDTVSSGFASIMNVLSTQVNEYQSAIHNNEIPSDTEVTRNDEEMIVKNWEDNFNQLLELTGDLIFFLDEQGCFLKVSNSCSLILDYDSNEITGKHFLDIIPSDYKTDAADNINKALSSKKISRFNTVLETKLGKQVHFKLTCRTIDRNSKVIGMMGIGSDVSRLNEYEKELMKLKPKLIEAQRIISIERARSWQQSSLLEELDRIKNEFVSNISHEFRTPLASIIGFSETIVSDPDLPEEMKSEFNHVILNEGKRLAKLINDVLDLTKIEGGKIALNKSTTDIVEIVRKAVDVNKEEVENKKLILDFEYPKEEIIVNIDGEKIAQAIDALINNAIKFTNEDGRVKVIVNNLFKEVEIIISDTGVGIPAKDLPYIFQKFYRVSRPGKEIPGTGIGLVFVKQLVDMHKGMISVQSELGSGTTFVVKFLKSFKIES